jgi:putative transposase
MRTGKPEHLKAFDYLGLHRYSLTFCTDRRRPLFKDEAVVNLVLEQILRAATENHFAVIAYCFMPDHLHLLTEGQADDSDLKRFIARAKQYSGFYYSKQYHDVLWQRYGFEHVLRDNEISLRVARYIVANPLRARLVERLQDYAFIGSQVYSREELIEGVAENGAE